MLTFKCSICGATVNAKDEDAGRVSVCASCSNKIVIPEQKPTLELIAEDLETTDFSRMSKIRSKPTIARVKSPNYILAVIAGYILVIIGALLILFGLFGLLTVLMVSGNAAQDSPSAGIFLAAFGISFQIGQIVMGIVIGAIGQVVLCVRDTAKNSFYLRRLK